MHTSSTTNRLPCAQAEWYKHVISSSSLKLLYRHFYPIKSGDTLLPLTAIRILRQNCRMYWASARSECDEKRIHNGIERSGRREILEEMGKRKKVQGRTKRGRDRYTWINRERERERQMRKGIRRRRKAEGRKEKVNIEYYLTGNVISCLEM